MQAQFSEAGVETGYRLDGSGFERCRLRHFLFDAPSWAALGLAQPLVKWEPGHIPGAKEAGAWLWSTTPVLHRGNNEYRITRSPTLHLNDMLQGD